MQHRALNPDDPLVTELSEVVRQALEPPQSVLTQCEATLEQMRDNFKLKKVEQKSKDSADAIFQQRSVFTLITRGCSSLEILSTEMRVQKLKNPRLRILTA